MQSQPKTLTLTHNAKAQIKQLKTAHDRSIDRKQNVATRTHCDVDMLVTVVVSSGVFLPEISAQNNCCFTFRSTLYSPLIQER